MASMGEMILFSVLTKLGWFFRMYWQRYTVAITFLITASVIDVIPPKLIGLAIDEIYLGTLNVSRLTQLLLLFLGIIFASYTLTYIWSYLLFGGSYLVERILRSRLMRHFLAMTPTFYERNRTGDLMARATNDLRAVSITVGFGVMSIVDSIFYMMAILVMMMVFINIKLTLAALIPFPFMAYAINRYGKKIHKLFAEAQDSFGKMNDNVLEEISGIRVIRAYVQERNSQKRFQETTDDVLRKNVAVAKVDSLFDPTIKVLVGVSYLIGLGYGANLVFHSELTLGELVSFNIYLGLLIWPMFAIGELINVMQRGSASLDRVNETFAYPADVEDVGTEAPTVPTSIEFNHVTFRYPSSQVDNLINVSFRLERGQTLGIVGRTGSGKTTVLKQLLRQYPLGSGELRIADLPLEKIALDRVKSWIGYVPQDQFLFSKSIRENILLGVNDVTEEQLQEAIQLASLSKDIEFLPDGLETLVGEKGIALSGGQKQRVAIARALILHPEVLMLDDTLSAVDAKTETEIVANLRRIRSDKTTIITTHRLSAVEHADLILVLEDGEIIQRGTHEQLLAVDGWYKEQYERQQIESTL